MRSTARLILVTAVILLAGGTGLRAAVFSDWSFDLDGLASPPASGTPDDASETAVRILFFADPACFWCERLRREGLTDPDVQALLNDVEVTEIDVARQPGRAAEYQVSRVPVLILFSSDGTSIGRIEGWLPASALAERLDVLLRGVSEVERDARVRRLIDALDDPESLSPSQWGNLLSLLGDASQRETVRRRLLQLSPFPREAIVERLTDPRLAVRLGALDILEEVSGELFGYDPWDTEAMDSLDAVAGWREWAGMPETEAGGHEVFAALTEDQALAYIRDVIADQPDRARRARRLLQSGGAGAAETIARYLDEQPELPPGWRNRLREIRYTIMLPPDLPVRAAVLAHRLVSGTMDDRLRALSDLGEYGSATLPVLREFLDDDLALVREMAAEALLKAGGREVLPVIEECLQHERQIDVLHSMLRGLGTVNDRAALPLIKPFFGHAEEDLAIVALHSAGRLRFHQAAEAVIKVLDDPRWRVRVAALETLASVGMRRGMGGVADVTRASWIPPVKQRLEDADEFVRFTAVRTFAQLAVDQDEALTVLEALYLADDTLKGPIAAAVSGLNRPWPDSFGTALDGKSVDVVIPVLEAALQSGARALSVAARFSDHAHADIACAALRVLATAGVHNSGYRAALVRALDDERHDRVLTVLRHLRVSSDMQHGLSAFEFTPMSWEETDGAADAGMQDIFDAFLSEESADRSEPADVPADSVPVTDVFAAFLGTGDDAGAADAGQVAISDLARAVRRHLEGDSEARFLAAMALMRLGDEAGMRYLRDLIEDRPLEDRLDAARELRNRGGDAALDLIRRLLRDSSSHVRRTAAMAAMQPNKGADGLRIVLDALDQSESLFQAREALSYSTTQVLQDGRARREARAWATRVINDPQADDGLRIMGLILLETVWRQGDERPVKSLLSHENIWIRRAAARTLAVAEPGRLAERAEPILQDPSEHVRLVIPISLSPGESRWQHRFGEQDDQQISYHSSFTRAGAVITPWRREVLNQCVADPSPSVRFEAFMALLSYRQPVDLGALADVVTAARRTDWNRRVANFVRANVDSLGPSFRVLMPVLDRSMLDAEMVRRLETRFGAPDDDRSLPAVRVRHRMADPRDDQVAVLPEAVATFVEPEVSSMMPDDPLTLVYFRSVGCRLCEDVEAWWPMLRRAFPGIRIEIFDIHRIDAMRLYENLSEHFGVPDVDRMVTPAVFSGAGFLIHRDITHAGLMDLLTASRGLPLADWRGLPETDEAAIDERIASRYRTRVRMGVVLAAGLLDGVNPCAFATIIFFLSYLQISRRPTRDMLQVCLAFILGVFVAYFSLGLGLIEIVARFDLLQRMGQWVNRGMAAFALLIMVLSIRDGILCLQGRLADISLQLPGTLKSGIHKAIRRGTHQTRFVLAAFVVGLIVSVLELACTGQVYLPTILFMLHSGADRVAIGYLLLYNLAFVAPLLVILVLGVFGLRHQRLLEMMRRHAARVKFATAALFLMLFLFFVFGDRWLGL